MWSLIIFTAAVVGFVYWKLIRPHSHWTRLGVPQGKPKFIFGDIWDQIIRKKAAPENLQTMYNYSQDSRYVGIYQFLSPFLLLKDPELIKQITVKDFDHFVDRKGFVPRDAEPLLAKTLFFLTGQQWKEMRSTLSSSFTSSKMKYMFSLMSQSGEQFIKHFLKEEKTIITVEMKNSVSRFATDVIGSTVFGFECDSLKNPENEFYKMGVEASDFTSIKKMLVFMGYLVVPALLKMFKWTLFSNKTTQYFSKLMKENIESREKFDTSRPDMINLLLQARKNNASYDESTSLPDAGFATAEESEIGKNKNTRKTKITDEDITSQAFIFFIAGFDSVSTLMSFMSYELAVNQDVQEKLISEIDSAFENCNGKLTYETITTMKYMDMVVSETLRKWPNALIVDRICTQPYTIQPKTPNEKPLHLKVNDVVVIPMYAIQRDPKFYPDPERFDPERFSDKNKDKIVPYTFIPFGSGPRNCIASRFALLETKILFFYLLSNFEITPVEKTQIPFRFNRKAMNMAPEKGFWLGLKRRVK